MIRDSTKQLRAERAARSQFKPGTLVAVVFHRWQRRIDYKSRVMKVYANGNFTICSADSSPRPQQWVPDWDGTSARPTGKAMGFAHYEHLEIWTPAHDAEIAERKAQRDQDARRRAVEAALGAYRDRMDEYTLRALEAALGLSTSAGNVPEAD